jgi:hypothetical protein
MEPIPYWRKFIGIAAVSGPAFGLLMGLLFEGMAMVTRGGFAPQRWLLTTLALSVGYGVPFGLVMAAIFRDVVVELPFGDRVSFFARLNEAFCKAGYAAAPAPEPYFEVHPGVRAGVMAGAIRVRLEERAATLVGPAHHLKKVVKRLGG